MDPLVVEPRPVDLPGVEVGLGLPGQVDGGVRTGVGGERLAGVRCAAGRAVDVVQGVGDLALLGRVEGVVGAAGAVCLDPKRSRRSPAACCFFGSRNFAFALARSSRIVFCVAESSMSKSALDSLP
jgi:hypothetical protein